MLDQYQKEYATQNVQFILVDEKGTILETDQAFLKLEINSSIFDVHAFFYTFESIKDTLENALLFSCVHIHFKDEDYVTDIRFVKKEEGYLIIITDYTSHYTEYQAIAQTRNESIINGELVAIKNAELEERENFKNSFIRNFSHELRNPLTSIISITKILSDTALTNQQQDMVTFLQQSNANLKQLLDDILSISMISSGRLKLRENIFSLSQLFDLLRFTYKTRALDNNIEFAVNVDKKIVDLVEGDRLRLFQVLTNLLDNAFKYTQTGSIRLDIQLNQKRANRLNLRFEIVDTGVGISVENQTAIFESFSQLSGEQNSDAPRGTGLGLSIVKGLLNLMDSEIKVISNVGEGSSFYFDLTLKQPLATTSKTSIITPRKKKDKKAKFRTDKKFRILLAEDDINVQTVLFKSLLDTNYFYIDLVSDGALVMEKLINEEYDLLLIDINLPNVTGDQVARLIRDFPFKNIKSIPIIGITAYSYEDDFKAFKKSGMNAVLSKPFEHEELLSTMAKYLK
ncbi:hybrid sensor histidine kinase/response regulator [Cellulophaga baltica]|uniref:histidine kinase n=1 Tax=Cellulophaga baltica 18 TaxID=1348584 RepID=A0AAU8RT30_9FLAO|nr:ATP-binding protein [Cellulophaga baltica]AIZ40889.1 histidine kinase [Cellulophaga baltica 18]